MPSTSLHRMNRIHSMLDTDTPFHPLPVPPVDTSTHPHRPRLHERDICPICRRALPALGPGGDESARETHIMNCIMSRISADNSDARNSLNLNPNNSPLQDRPHAHPPLPVNFSSLMLPFTATEKDCMSAEDGTRQECTICMVEYDVGHELARLECLCKFHKECIVSWFERKQECPVHKVA